MQPNYPALIAELESRPQHLRDEFVRAGGHRRHNTRHQFGLIRRHRHQPTTK